MRVRAFIFFLIDIFLIFVSFYISLAIKENSFTPFPKNYVNSFVLFTGIWMVISLLLKKYRLPLSKETKLMVPVSKILLANAIILGIISTLMYLTRISFYSRALVFGTISVLTLTEMLFCSVYYWIRTATLQEPFEDKHSDRLEQFKQISMSKKDVGPQLSEEAVKKRQKTLLHELSPEAFNFIFKYVPIDSSKTHLASTISHVNIDLLNYDKVDSLVNLVRINDIRYINKFFESVNAILSNGGLFVDFLETKNQRKKRILRKFPLVLGHIYYFFDFILKRVFPKFAITKRLYFIVTRGVNRVLTKAEAFGRLYSCGFEVIDELEDHGHLFFIAIKTKEPLFPEKPTYGPLIRLNRVGKGGKIIKVYKLRTMHPYSEFLQDYVYRKAGLKEGGKFKSDFRISNLGKFFRTFWLDELPMLLNFIRGDMKIVGVRPLSKHYFSLYTKEHQERRIKYKPGLVPPFYVDKPKNLEEIMASEKKYFDLYDKHPIWTDLRYFFKAFYNIIFKHYRSG